MRSAVASTSRSGGAIHARVSGVALCQRFEGSDRRECNNTHKDQLIKGASMRERVCTSNSEDGEHELKPVGSAETTTGNA
jgi:hypothetical protein